MTVKKVGWSWGGCFADFDNDTFLDLYVLSGYFTAPGRAGLRVGPRKQPLAHHGARG